MEHMGGSDHDDLCVGRRQVGRCGALSRRVKFVSKGSGLPVQLQLRQPGHPYAALVGADWPETRSAYVITAPTYGAYAFMQRDLADELERVDLGALTRALGAARSRPGPITTTVVAFEADGRVQTSGPSPNRPSNMPEETWAQVVDHLESFDRAGRDEENAERAAFRASFDESADRLLPSMSRQPSDPPLDQSEPLSHKVWRGNILLKRNKRKVGRYYPSERVLILADEDERPAAIQYLMAIGEDPLPPLNGSRSPSLRGQVSFYEGHYFVVYSDLTHQGRGLQNDNKIAVYSPETHEVLNVTSAWSNATRELLAAHGLRVGAEIQPSDADGAIRKAAQRLVWHTYQLDPEGEAARQAVKGHTRLTGVRGRVAVAPSPPRLKALAERAEAHRRESPTVLDPQVAATLPPAVAEAVAWLLDRHSPVSVGEWSREQDRMAVLSERKLTDLAAAVEPIAPSPTVRALSERARRVSPAHAAFLAAFWSREFAPEWFTSLPWHDRELPARDGRDDRQKSLWEMTDQQVSQSAQPTMLTLLRGTRDAGRTMRYEGEALNKEPVFPQLDLHGVLTQNEVARLWLAVASLRQNDLVEGHDPLARRTCLVCQRVFPVGSIPIVTINFTRSDKICRDCGEAALYGQRRKVVEPESLRSEAMSQGLAELATNLGGPPTRSQLDVPLDGLNDNERARQIALRMSLSSTVSMTQLQDAGLLPDAYRPSRGVYSIANDGHECRSLFERQVDDFLSSHGIPHEIEPPYPRDDVLNTTGLRGDWLLGDGTFVEAAGMTNPEYLAKLQVKRDIAVKYGFDLIILTTKDLPSLEARFARWLGDE